MAHKELASLANERANRIKRLRSALRFSRQKLADKYTKYGLTSKSLQNWENSLWNGLTEEGALKLTKAFHDEGLNVTVEWLLFGIGEDPIGNLDDFFNVPVEIKKPSEKAFIAKEIQLLHQHCKDIVDTIITDDSLAPWLMPGDYVAGKRYFDQDMEKAIGQPCIAQTNSGETLIRILKAGKDLEYYTLVSSNPDTTATRPVIEDIQLFSVAPIAWIRKPITSN